MAKYAFGIKSIKMGDINPLTGLSDELEDIGQIFRDTCDMVEGDPTVTPILSEQKSDPVITFNDKGEESLNFSVMDTGAENFPKFFGGTVTELEGVKTWNAPVNMPLIFAHVQIETVDGSFINIPRGQVMAKKNFQFRRQGILLIDVMVRPQVPQVESLAPLSISDPVDPNYVAP